jgi:hypothetical protein
MGSLDALPFKLTKRDIAALATSIDTHLLHSVALIEGNSKPNRDNSDNTPHNAKTNEPTNTSRTAYEQALHRANEAMEIAETFGRYEAMPKVQLQRGYCFLGLGMWKKAHECFVLAASNRACSREVEALTRECLDRIVADAGRFSAARMMNEEAERNSQGNRALEAKKQSKGQSLGKKMAIREIWRKLAQRVMDRKQDDHEMPSQKGMENEASNRPGSKKKREREAETAEQKTSQRLTVPDKRKTQERQEKPDELLLLRNGYGRIVGVQDSVLTLRSANGSEFCRRTRAF